MWTEFWDMHSGGGQKEKWSLIFIEAPERDAKIIFYNRFGHNPDRVTCTCCGGDYSINESDSIEQITGYHRNCAFDRKKNVYIEEQDSEKYSIRYASRPYMTVEEFKKKDDVLFIHASQIKPEDFKVKEIPEQGYVWKE